MRAETSYYASRYPIRFHLTTGAGGVKSGSENRKGYVTSGSPMTPGHGFDYLGWNGRRSTGSSQ